MTPGTAAAPQISTRNVPARRWEIICAALIWHTCRTTLSTHIWNSRRSSFLPPRNNFGQRNVLGSEIKQRAKLNFKSSAALREKAHALIPGGAHTYAKGDDQFPEISPGFIA